MHDCGKNKDKYLAMMQSNEAKMLVMYMKIPVTEHVEHVRLVGSDSRPHGHIAYMPGFCPWDIPSKITDIGIIN